jgi:Rhs element Vgr protein
MAQYVQVGISVEGKNIQQFYSFSLSQSIFDHHSFRLVCPAEALDGTSGAVLHTSKNIIGGAISVKIDAVNKTGSLQFTGVITQVEASRHNGHAGDIIISGYSPTVLLANGPHCQSWEKQPLKNIVNEVLQPFPQNLLKSKITPTHSEPLSYVVQYRETAWQFLNRLAAFYGEWLLYDGQKLVMGAPQGQKTKLLFGSNLQDFSMALQVQPAFFEVMAYDYINHEVYNGHPAGISSKAGLNDFGKHTFQKSEKFFNARPREWYNYFLTNKKQLDDYVDTRAMMHSSNMVRFQGKSEHPGLQLGAPVSVDGKNVFSQAQESYGDYHVIAIHHHCDGQGNYANDFTAVPASVKMPPVTPVAEPRCETQSAIVVDNHDPQGLGRVQVRFHWMAKTEKSPWLRVTTPHAGDGKGLFFMPEVNEEVIVGFEGDCATKPFIIGCVYHGKAKNAFASKGNDIKTLQSRSGVKIVLNDKQGSLQMADSKGNEILLDGAGNITVKSSKRITIKSKDIDIVADDAINIHAATININAEQELNMKGEMKGVNTKGKKIDTASDTSVTVSGKSTKISGEVQLELESSALAKVKATIVQIN